MIFLLGLCGCCKAASQIMQIGAGHLPYSPFVARSSLELLLKNYRRPSPQLHVPPEFLILQERQEVLEEAH